MLQQGAGRVQPILHDELREGHPLATPELLHGTPLARRMHEFTFFAYRVQPVGICEKTRKVAISFLRIILN